MPKIIHAAAISNYQIDVRFDDGTHGRIDLSQELYGPMFEPLRDPNFFAKFFVDQLGVICWPNGADIAPDAIYAELKTLANQR